MEKTQLEFGFSIYPYSRVTDIDDLARIVRRADELGYFSIGFPEHMLPPPSATELLANEQWPDVPTLAAYLAASTTRIRFIPGVSVLPYHPPIQYAKQLATLDHVTKGRLILGVGTGWFEEEFERLGLPFAERGAMTDEYLAAMIELWTSDRPTFSGKYVSFNDITFQPKCYQQPHIPLFIGGTGAAPARRTAELGHGWHPMVGTLEERRHFFLRVKEMTAERGRDPESLWFTGSVDVSHDPATEQATKHVSADRYADFGAEQGRDQVIAAVQEQVGVGCDLINAGFRWDTVDHMIANLERFAEEIIPAFR